MIILGFVFWRVWITTKILSLRMIGLAMGIQKLLCDMCPGGAHSLGKVWGKVFRVLCSGCRV